ncbi:SRPBCC family protein [Undibacterium arcticum]|uniref:SRPBCC family protein n=1 Tax=Undibacterium arcticum TaxID=1762892 RepID=UPI0036F3F69D
MMVNDAAKQWELFSLTCVRVDTEIDIDCSPQQVFDYASTPALWHTWHPATVEVRNVPDRPLTAGETMLELIAVAGRRDQAIWTVLACVPPQRWEITTDTCNGMAHIIYTIMPTDSGCRFHRTLEYRSKRRPWRHLDATLTRWILKRQSSRALQNLKTVLERRRSSD